MSERCCFCCARFLSELHPKLKYAGSHGKVQAWTPPANAPMEAKAKVLEALQEKLIAYIESHMGSDDDAVDAVVSVILPGRIANQIVFLTGICLTDTTSSGLPGHHSGR